MADLDLEMIRGFGSTEAHAIWGSACPESADIVDALAAIADPHGKAAERVKLHTTVGAIEFLHRKLATSLAIPHKYMGVDP